MSTKAMKARLSRIADLGCLPCGDMGYHGSPAEIHHQLGQGRDDNKVIPMCAVHHRNGGFGECVHNGTKTFEANHGTQAEMVERINKLVPPVTVKRRYGELLR